MQRAGRRAKDNSGGTSLALGAVHLVFQTLATFFNTWQSQASHTCRCKHAQSIIHCGRSTRIHGTLSLRFVPCWAGWAMCLHLDGGLTEGRGPTTAGPLLQEIRGRFCILVPCSWSGRYFHAPKY
ncbi:hypothetical protein N656DRAFT_310773 [Canariomyces notabilis]|uniref:Uncharacterized protein n=1 Tax=Canariomyces notabilis TaxID=2074819 RepID=A0AAN6T9N4_9PEZI|nr:hypothetical protein N656DRAFT_310773 [Canariomyces arenarius]